MTMTPKEKANFKFIAACLYLLAAITLITFIIDYFTEEY